MALDSTARISRVASLVMLTLAFDTGVLLASVTRPVVVLVNVWANKADATRIAAGKLLHGTPSEILNYRLSISQGFRGS